MSLGLDNFLSCYVYRVLRPDEDPTQDITCISPHSNRSINQHIETGLRIPSKLISTTSSMECALLWMKTADAVTSHIYGNTRSTIVKIDIDFIKRNYPHISNSAVDLTNWSNREKFLKYDKQKSYAAAYKEIIFEHSIPSEAVSVEYILGEGFIRKEITESRKHMQARNPIFTTQNNLSFGWNNQFGNSAYEVIGKGGSSANSTSLRQIQAGKPIATKPSNLSFGWNNQFGNSAYEVIGKGGSTANSTSLRQIQAGNPITSKLLPSCTTSQCLHQNEAATNLFILRDSVRSTCRFNNSILNK